MTVGVYALYWEEQDLIYIGQSHILEIREYEHKRLMKVGKANYKLQDAYNQFGFPSFNVLLNCTKDRLDEEEFSLIEEFNATGLKGCNILKVPFGTGKDTEHSAAKFSKEEILNAVYLLLDTKNKLNDITKLTKISPSVLSSISTGQRHTWIKEEIGIEKYNELLSIDRAFLNKRDSKDSNYWIKSPTSIIYKVDNISEFARKHKLLGTKLNEVLRSKRKSHCGWIKPTEQEIQNVIV